MQNLIWFFKAKLMSIFFIFLFHLIAIIAKYSRLTRDYNFVDTKNILWDNQIQALIKKLIEKTKVESFF